jgi:hypothetical protein
MEKKEEAKKQAVPVMKQLARAMSSEEVASVTGASGNGCAPSSGDNTPGHHDPPDFQF